MIDPSDVTKYDRTVPELEEFLCFCLCVAGHNAKTTAKHLDKFFKEVHTEEPTTEGFLPLTAVGKLDVEEVRFFLKKNGIGSHGLRAKGLHYLANAGLDLAKCTRHDLLKVPGIGMKTASYFILHTRKDARIACLDRHVMRWLSSKGHEGLPDNTPPTTTRYLRVEALFLQYADELKMTPAQLDLQIWNESTGSTENIILGIK